MVWNPLSLAKFGIDCSEAKYASQVALSQPKLNILGKWIQRKQTKTETKTNAETKTKKEMVVKMVTNVVLVDDLVSSCEIVWCIQRLSIMGSRQAALSSYIISWANNIRKKNLPVWSLEGPFWSLHLATGSSVASQLASSYNIMPSNMG